MEPIKKKIISAFCVLVAVGIVSAILLYFVDFDGDKREEIPQNSIDFYSVDYGENIFEDEEYMELNRYIAYTEGATTTLITDGDHERYGPIVSFFAEFIDSIVRGDHERYNTFFAEEYLEANGRKDVFTMQQLYNIELKYLDAREVEHNGNEYLLHEVDLEYMIRHNNGTFRSDMGSDAIRRQRFGVIERNGKLEILTLNTFVYAH